VRAWNAGVSRWWQCAASVQRQFDGIGGLVLGAIPCLRPPMALGKRTNRMRKERHPDCESNRLLGNVASKSNLY